MISVDKLVVEVAHLINDYEPDYEHIRWTRDELIEYANDAALQISMMRPDQFADSVNVPLVAGREQRLPDDISRLLDVIGVRDQFGRLQGKPSRKDLRASNVASNYFSGLGCEPVADDNGGYVLKSFEYSPANPKVLYVNPPVPAGLDVELAVTAVKSPDPVVAGGDLSLDARFHNAVVEWMLYRAFGKDTESANDAQISQQHLGHFYEIVRTSAGVDGVMAVATQQQEERQRG